MLWPGSLWSSHASLFNVTQDLLATFESWQFLTWAVLITVMARILIKSLFTYPGASWSLIGPLVCSGTAASLVCVAAASLSQTAVPSSHGHGRHDKWRRTRGGWTHPQLSEIEMSYQAEKCQWVISGKVLFRFWFSSSTPIPSWKSAPLHKMLPSISLHSRRSRSPHNLWGLQQRNAKEADKTGDKIVQGLLNSLPNLILHQILEE